jgi:signal transduction histidine kinase
MDSAKRALLGTVLAALTGILLVIVGTLYARSRITGFMDRSLAREAEELGVFLGADIEDVLATEAEALSGRGTRPELANPRTWQRSFDSVCKELARFPGFVGLAVTCSGQTFESPGFAPYRGRLPLESRAQLVESAVVLSRIPFSGAANVDIVLARTHLKHVEERRRLLDFVAFVPVAVAVAAWVVVLSFWYFGRGVRRVLELQRQSALRLKIMSEAARGIAHEVRNPMNAVSLTLQYIERYIARHGQPPSGGEFQRIHAELGQVNHVVAGFVRMARADELELSRLPFSELLAAAGLNGSASAGAGVQVLVDKARMVEVLKALFADISPDAGSAMQPELSIEVIGSELRLRCARPPRADTERTTRSSPLLTHTLARIVLEAHGGSLASVTDEAGGFELLMTLPVAR